MPTLPVICAFAGGEQLLRVGARPARAAQFPGRGQLYVKHVVGRDGAAFAASSGGGLGRVKDLFDGHGALLLGNLH